MLQPIQQLSFVNKLSCNSTDKSPVKSNNIPKQNNEPLQVNAYYLPANITFRGKNNSAPVEITADYTPKIKSNDHLDLPNVHVFEYPDTKLQLFLNTPNVSNKDEKNKIAVKLYLSNNEQDTDYTKNLIAIYLINKQLKMNHLNFKAEANNNGFYTINGVINNTNLQEIQTLNKIITEPCFDDKSFEEAKKILHYLCPDNTHINEIHLANLKNYYENTLKNAEAKYFISMDKQQFNTNKKELFNAINSNLNKFTIHRNETSTTFIPNTEMKIVHNIPNTENIIHIQYPFTTNSVRDSLIAVFTSLVIMMSKSRQFSCDTEILQQDAFDKLLSNNNYSYHQLSFEPERENLDNNDLINTELSKQQEFLKTFTADDEVTNTVLAAIKKHYKELIKEDFNNDSIITTNEALYNYDYDSFKINEIIDSIDAKDIETHIKTYLLGQQPIIIVPE